MNLFMTGLNFDSAKVVIPSLISNPLRSEEGLRHQTRGQGIWLTHPGIAIEFGSPVKVCV